MRQFPIDEVLPEIRSALQGNNGAVLVAAPGAGKTTRVPLALLEEPWLKGRKIVMLEPRRLAARAAARFMAHSIGQPVGEMVGYRVKMDTVVGPNTRLEVITEGVFTRMLQSDPTLEEVGLVIFDEFHERSLNSDLGLALCLQAQGVFREDLRVLVMSATLAGEAVAAMLHNPPLIVSQGRSYPVETCYLQRPVTGPIEAAVVTKVQEALARHQGDVLVFLPGAREIRRVELRLAEVKLGEKIRVACLYGNLPLSQQDAAIAPALPGERKVVLATSIAETSLTVEGVQVVIDSGLMRIPRFSPRTGMTHLHTLQVSRDSADQRRGRAGRLGPGVCYRLWTLEEDRQLTPRRNPEILETDLSPLALELALWGVREPAELCWLDQPPAGAMAQARELLGQLGALDGRGSITSHGKRMTELGLHPRLAHMILQAETIGLGDLACELAVLLGNRDLLGGQAGQKDVDMHLRVLALRHSAQSEGSQTEASRVAKGLGKEVRQLKNQLAIPTNQCSDPNLCGILMAFAYPDRVGQARETGKFLLRNGRRAVLPGFQHLSNSQYIVAAELDDQGSESRIHLAAPLEERDIRVHFAGQIKNAELVYWDQRIQNVQARRRQSLGAIVLKDEPWPNPSSQALVGALLEGIKQEGLSLLPWTKGAQLQLQRQRFMQAYSPEWPDGSDEGLVISLEEWLGPHLYGMKSGSDLQKLNLADILEQRLSWEQRRQLEEYAPKQVVVPSGSRIAVDYSDPEKPVLAVRLQEMFGLQDTPRILGGRIPLTLHLLSPAHRPVQVTQDLAGFWRTAYFEVRKDLRGRYPKHHWPENPLDAPPTNRAKPRS